MTLVLTPLAMLNDKLAAAAGREGETARASLPSVALSASRTEGGRGGRDMEATGETPVDAWAEDSVFAMRQKWLRTAGAFVSLELCESESRGG